MNIIEHEIMQYQELIIGTLYGAEMPTDRSIEIEIDGYWYNIDECLNLIDALNDNEEPALKALNALYDKAEMQYDLSKGN